MTTIGVNLGGAAGPAPGGQPEHWMRPNYEARTAVDWGDAKYQTPKPAPKSKFGKYREPILDVPQLPERNIRVRSKPPAGYYTLDGVPIPSDQWVTVPISPTLIQAIKDGDIERGADPTDEAPPQQPRRRHTHTTTVTPAS